VLLVTEWTVTRNAGRGVMDCKEFEKLIPDFISQKLDYPGLLRFREHMEHCEDCKEELTIQFLVTEGIQRLEDGNAFDLQKELRLCQEEARRKIHFHDAFLRVGVVLEAVAVCAILGFVIWILI